MLGVAGLLRHLGDHVPHARPGEPARRRVAAAAPGRRSRSARRRAGPDLRRHGDRGARRVRRLVSHRQGTGAVARPAVMRRFLGYYRQFDELSPEEISRELRERRAAERTPVRQDALDLSGGGWYEPPHPEVVNAATFALRRAVNAYPDPEPLRQAIAAAHGVDPGRVVVGHGAGELLRAALRVLAHGHEVRLAWPGWAPLPRLVHEAGGHPVPVAPDALLAPARGWSDPPARVLVLGRPADPTG